MFFFCLFLFFVQLELFQSLLVLNTDAQKNKVRSWEHLEGDVLSPAAFQLQALFCNY